MLPTLPNLYGLDVRFKYVERKLKEEKDRRKAMRQVVKPSTENIKNEDSPPVNRHGRLVKKYDYISPMSYKIKPKVSLSKGLS